MVLDKKTFSKSILLAFFLFGWHAICQTTNDSYEKLWQVIQNDTVTRERKLSYLDIYYQKAQFENNTLETYRSLEKKSYLVSFNDAVSLMNVMKPLITKMNNDSLSGDFLNRNTVLYYNNRHFKEALDYALQSEAFNEKNQKLYSLNFVRITIGNIYYHSRNYEKALFFFNQAKDFYKKNGDPNHQQAYAMALYSLGKTYWQLNNTSYLTATVIEADRAITFLNPSQEKLEKAYLNYIKGGLAYLKNDYPTAKYLFYNALPVIKENEDFSNEHIIYLYLGKIAWQQNQKMKALDYFTKIDAFFKDQKFLNYELRETYDYLIKYYKETNQPKLQLQATESLITLNQQFEKEQQHLTNTLHYELDTKKLENSKNALTNELHSSKNTLAIWFIVSGLLCLVLVTCGFWQNKQKKQWRLQYNLLLDDIEENTISETKTTQVAIEDENIVSEPKNTLQTTKLSVTELRLLKDLELFENEKGFLQPLKLDDLANQLNTNRNTLSRLINVQKNANFNQYINSLRLKQILVDLKNNKQLRKLGMQALAETYGFTNAKTFTTQFKIATLLTPAYYIEQLELDDIQKTKNA